MKKRWDNDAQYAQWIRAWDVRVDNEYQMVQSAWIAKVLAFMAVAFILLACLVSTIVPASLTWLFLIFGMWFIACEWFALWDGFKFKRVVDQMVMVIDHGDYTIPMGAGTASTWPQLDG